MIKQVIGLLTSNTFSNGFFLLFFSLYFFYMASGGLYYFYLSIMVYYKYINKVNDIDNVVVSLILIYYLKCN